MGFLSYCLKGDNTLCDLRTSWRAFDFDLKLELVLYCPGLLLRALCYTWSVNDKENTALGHLMKGLTYSPLKSAQAVLV